MILLCLAVGHGRSIHASPRVGLTGKLLVSAERRRGRPDITAIVVTER